jgi:hypothetical protein
MISSGVRSAAAACSICGLYGVRFAAQQASAAGREEISVVDGHELEVVHVEDKR